MSFTPEQRHILPRQIGAWPYARVTHSVSQSIPNATFTLLAFDTLSRQGGGVLWTAGVNSRLVAPIAGIYRATLAVEWPTNATGERIATIRANGSTVEVARDRGPGFAAGTAHNQYCAAEDLSLAVGGYVEAWVYQSSGAALACNADPDMAPIFTLRWLGAA